MPARRPKSGIELLLKAAEFIERRDREEEHGYACTAPVFVQPRRNVVKSRRKKGVNRAVHNLLEKNRRAQLRVCLDRLKDAVPLPPGITKHTTLGLLRRASAYIKSLQERDRRHEMIKEKLHRERRYLQRRLESLGADAEFLERRGIIITKSTCTSTITVAPSTSVAIGSGTAGHSGEEANPAAFTRETARTPISESDEVDVIGYTSTVSEDEPSSGRSSSDSGVVVSGNNAAAPEKNKN